VFDRVWNEDLIKCVLRRLRKEFQTTGKILHYEVFRLYEVLPMLLRDVARELGLTGKQAEDYLVTARRAFLRLLGDEIRGYGGS
jgi:hypothetical protein